MAENCQLFLDAPCRLREDRRHEKIGVQVLLMHDTRQERRATLGSQNKSRSSSLSMERVNQ